jgi:hypothetical protein
METERRVSKHMKKRLVVVLICPKPKHFMTEMEVEDKLKISLRMLLTRGCTTGMTGVPRQHGNHHNHTWFHLCHMELPRWNMKSGIPPILSWATPLRRIKQNHGEGSWFFNSDHPASIPSPAWPGRGIRCCCLLR